MRSRRLPSTVLASIVVLLSIAGCAPAGPTVSETPTPTPTPTPVVEVGAIIDAEAAAELNEAKGEQRGYPMPDGTYILVSKDAPLPEAVQNDVNAKGTAYTTAFPAVDPAGGKPMENARAQVMGEIGQATGKQVVFGMKIAGYINADDENMTTIWFFNGAFSSPEPRYYTKADAEAAVNAWLATKENPNDYVVVWGD